MRHRLLASLLLAVFLGAGTTLPGPDALLYHWGAQPGEHHTHIEPAGGCGAHADHCTLGRAATGAGAAITPAPVLRAEPADTPGRAVTRGAEIVVADLVAIPHSRAPPPSAV